MGSRSHAAKDAERKQRADNPGEVPDSRIPIYDYKGRMRGRVGPRATEVTVSRFINQHGAKLGKKDGRDAWLGPEPPPKPKPKIDPAAKAAAGAGGAPGEGPNKGSPTHSLEISLKSAKGSAKPAAKK
jgi:hypothetical protein